MGMPPAEAGLQHGTLVSLLVAVATVAAVLSLFKIGNRKSAIANS
jgi:hypothetical protein